MSIVLTLDAGSSVGAIADSCEFGVNGLCNGLQFAVTGHANGAALLWFQGFPSFFIPFNALLLSDFFQLLKRSEVASVVSPCGTEAAPTSAGFSLVDLGVTSVSGSV